MHSVRIGVALELGSDQYARSNGAPLDFLEYGLQLWRGFPEWVSALQAESGSTLHIHPLDVNLSGGKHGGDAWLVDLARLTTRTGATALVSDLGFWYHRRRASTWERPPLMSVSGINSAFVAAAIADACGIPFRVENPPVEWMPGRPSIWRYLEEASRGERVDICLDVSHLIQFEHNVHSKRSSLPRDFPWHRVTELHLAGYVDVEYRGMRRKLDQHVAEIRGDQLSLAGEILNRCDGRSIDICLEMEPRSMASWTAAAGRLRAALANR